MKVGEFAGNACTNVGLAGLLLGYDDSLPTPAPSPDSLLFASCCTQLSVSGSAFNTSREI